MTHVHN